jgi:hypothetical protein
MRLFVGWNAWRPYACGSRWHDPGIRRLVVYVLHDGTVAKTSKHRRLAPGPATISYLRAPGLAALVLTEPPFFIFIFSPAPGQGVSNPREKGFEDICPP